MFRGSTAFVRTTLIHAAYQAYLLKGDVFDKNGTNILSFFSRQQFRAFNNFSFQCCYGLNSSSFLCKCPTWISERRKRRINLSQTIVDVDKEKNENGFHDVSIKDIVERHGFDGFILFHFMDL